jgi:hypothetical protein
MNSDQLTTYLGLAQAIGTAAVTFYTTASSEGAIDLKNPIFWMGLAVAVLMGVKGYWTNKHLTPAPTPAVKTP